MIIYADARVAFAKAIYDLLSESDGLEAFTIARIAQKAGIEVGAAFVSRILTISEETDEVFVSDSEGYWTLGKEGFDLVEAHEFARTASDANGAPASDRVVRFNHNAPEAEKISAQIAELKESVRGANGPEIDEQERERVFAALNIAQEFWQSGNLRLIQLKVGVVMAVEDAGILLAKTAKHVAAAVLVDAIKAFVKNYLHADLDGI